MVRSADPTKSPAHARPQSISAILTAVLFALAIAAPLTVHAAETPSPAQFEFFETHIRPVLVEQCYSCHNSAKTAEGSLALDSRAGLLKGGEGGAIVVPGKPAASRLLPILRHEVAKLKMPRKSGKLDDRVIADFEKWIAMGAPDPRDKPPTAEQLAKATSWETILAKRKQWWSFQPIRRVSPPVVAGNTWSRHPVDLFVLAKLREKGLEPGEPAEPRTLVRRLYFDLIGLPPAPDELQLWTAKVVQPSGYAELVDHLLADPHFGEKWARHWMDWIRYADSHGSEGDPTIEGAWLYRDYLIRALNADVSFDQLVREHVAGDLLEQPRINKQLGINESMIGPAHWRMVFHGYAPTDALEEKVRFIDDEINTFSKAFLGLTVSCARCHNHKFDPISQRDYYALFGILGSCRPGRVVIDSQEKLDVNRDKLAALKPQIRSAVARAWLDSASRLRGQLLANDSLWKKADNAKSLLHPWFLLHKEAHDSAQFAGAWNHRVAAWKNDRRQRDEFSQRNYWRHWNLSRPADYATWFHQGNGLGDKPASAGGFSVSTEGENVLAGIYPAGALTNSLTAKSPARFSSADVHLAENYDLFLRVIGDGESTARYVVQDYPRSGTVYPDLKIANEWQWQKMDMTYWNGDDVHIELTAGKDAPLMATNDARSWFGAREAVIARKGEPGPPMEPQEFLDSVFEAASRSSPKSFDDLADAYVAAVTNAVQAWQGGSVTDAQALLLDACLKQGILPNQLKQLASVRPLIDEYRKLEEEMVVPTRVPGLEETVGHDQPLLERGNHKKPGELVPRRFLEAIDATPYKTTQSGRRQLAEDLLRDDNPLTRRVIVNRLWHHLFDRGIVATPDNFGKLGQGPTHPELLDYLATRFKDHGGSLKEMIRFIVMSRTWQLTSHPSEKAQKLDPDNQFLSHTHVRRLEAEAIRDSLLAVSGTLSPDKFGAPVGGNSNRRSIYVAVRRTSLDPFLRSFDFPEPFSATGRRDSTNVPAQSLMMMNDEFVATLAKAWAARIMSDKKLAHDEDRIRAMFLMALGRPAQPGEIGQFQAYLAQVKSGQSGIAKQIADLRRQIEERQTAMARLTDPIRTRLLAEAKVKPHVAEHATPKPIGRWDFKDDLRDLVGSAHGEARESAVVKGGALLVSRTGYVITAPLQQTLKEKTLEAWVQLDNLDQRGGGVMTIMTPNGAVFDAIVFGEQNPRQWMAGSNFFQRTQTFNGPQEQDAAGRPVHVAIAYHADGMIACYRDGQPYGKPYKSKGPMEFAAGKTVVGFGLRHFPAGGDHMLAGRILRAQLYDRALNDDEIRATSQSAPYFISESKILAELTETDRKSIAADKQKIADLEVKIAAISPVSESVDDTGAWTDLARAMFTFKEFIYLK